MEDQNKAERYVIVEGQRVYLTPEQQKVWDQGITKARHDAFRDHACIQPDYHKCSGDCGHCPWQVAGIRVELDAISGDGNGSISMAYNREADPEESYCQKETLSQIYAYARKQDPMGEKLLRMRFVEDMTIREIADTLELSKSDVDRRLAKILTAVRKQKKIFF